MLHSETPAKTASPDASDELWLMFEAHRRIEDRNRLVIFYSPLVNLVAKRVGGRTRPFEDVCQWGQIGLIDAVERFDASQGYLFATYATYRIRGAIIDGMRQSDPLPKRVRARVNELVDAREVLAGTLLRLPSVKEVADHLHVDVLEIMDRSELEMLSEHPQSLTMLLEISGGIAFRTGDEPSDRAERSSLRDSVRGALANLTDRQRHAVVLHYLEGFKKSEVAEVMGIDRSRVTQLLCAAVKKLRVDLESVYSLAD